MQKVALNHFPPFWLLNYSETIRAFNLAEQFMTPVILLLDEVIAKAHEDIDIPGPQDISILEKPGDRIEGLNIYDRRMGEARSRVDFFEGYAIHIDGLEHDKHGWPTTDPDTVHKMQTLRLQKIYNYLDDIIKYREYYMDDAEIMIFSFGVSARAAVCAVEKAREQGIKVGLFQALTIWPFPDRELRERFKRIKKVLTVELNMGQTKYEIERVAPGNVKQKDLLRANGIPFTPQEVLQAIQEF